MDHVLKTIQDIKAQIQPLEEKIAEKKRFVNQLCELAKIPLEYSGAELSVSASSSSVASIRPDQFFNRPLATVAREYLEMRKSANLGPVGLDEFYAALKSGGFVFQGASEDGKKNGLATSLGKNNTMFVRLPSNKWGLANWYGINKRQKRETNGGDTSGGDAEPKTPEQSSGEESPAPKGPPGTEVFDES